MLTLTSSLAGSAAGTSFSASFSSPCISSLALFAFSCLSTKSLKESRSLFPLYWSVCRRKTEGSHQHLDDFGQIKLEKALITCRKTYLLAIVEKEQCGISPYTVLRAHLIMLSTVHLNRTKTCALKRKFTYVSVEWPNKGVRGLSHDQHPVLLSLYCFNVLVIEVPTFPILTSSVCSKVVASCSQVGAMALQWPHHGAKNLMKWDPGRGGKKKKATKNFSF